MSRPGRAARRVSLVATLALCLLALTVPADADTDRYADLDIDSAHRHTMGDDIAPGDPTRPTGDLGPLAERPSPAVAPAPAVTTGGSVRWAEDASQNGDVPGVSESNDRFGTAVVVADFTRDGIGDVVVGSPGENVSGFDEAGSITLLTGAPREFWLTDTNTRTTPTASASQAGAMAGSLEAGDEFGAALAAGDFDGNGTMELAVGAPGEAIGSKDDAGVVTVVPIDALGLFDAASRAFAQSTAGIQGAAEAGDRLGASLAVGDFNGDGRDDLAAGVPGEDIGSKVDAGAVAVLYGSSGGISASGNDFFSQSTSGVDGAAEAGDRFGEALAAGDVDGDGFDDLIIGVPGEDIGSTVDAGAIAVLYGTSQGLTTAGDRSIHQASPNIEGAGEADDRFGSALASADLDLDGYDDIVVGGPGEDVGSAVDAGAIWVLPGSASGPRSDNDRVITQATSGVKGGAEAGDEFGAAVAVGDVTGSVHEDVLVGVPGEGIGSDDDAGAIAVLPGSSSGVTATGDLALHAASSGIPGAAEPGDRFGHALAAGDLNGDEDADLVIGTPEEDLGSAVDSGAILTVDPRSPIPWVTSDQADDTSGDQIHVLYVLPADADEGRAMDAAIRTEIAVIDNWYDGELGGKRLNFDTTGGALDISTIRLDQTEAEIANDPNNADALALLLALDDAGFDEANTLPSGDGKLYLVYYEGQGTDPGTCGVSFSYYIAIMWMDACGGIYPSFTNFPFGSTYLVVHELTHGIGAVDSEAPNHCCQGHLDDDNRDVLYQGNLGRDWNNLTLDPGNDDYWLHSGSWDDIDDNEVLVTD